MFQFLFKYPSSVFAKGEFVLLGGWPRWVLALLLLATATASALFIRSRLSHAPPHLRTWRSGLIWLLQFCLIALLLVILWNPAIVVAELKPQQNIIAVLVDDSRSMGVAEGGTTRQAQAIQTLEGGMLTELEKSFQTRLYRLDSRCTRISSLAELKPAAPATH